MTGLLKNYIGSGLIADRPATPDVAVGTLALYWAEDEKILYAWDADLAAWDAFPVSEGIAEAPADGEQYVRKDEAWEPVTIPAAGIEEAPEDGSPYVRLDGAWVPQVDDAGIEDAPSDGTPYVRQDNDLVASPTGPTPAAPFYGYASAIAGGASTSNFASKGRTVKPVLDVEVTDLFFWIDATSGLNYQATVAELGSVTSSSATITAIKGTSGIITATSTANQQLRFEFDSAVALEAGKDYAVIVTRLGGTPTTALSINNASLGTSAIWVGFPGGNVRALTLASNSPAVGESVNIITSAFSGDILGKILLA